MTDTSGNCWREGPRFDLPNPKGVRNCPKGEVLKEGISTQNQIKIYNNTYEPKPNFGGNKKLN